MSTGIGARLALSAQSPQDPYVWGNRLSWVPSIQTHTPFAVTQKALQISSINGFLGQQVQVDIYPKDLPDLLSNMHLKFSLPTGTYTPQVGRAIIQSVSFVIDGYPIEILTDDWYVVRDDLFLDADQKTAMYDVIGAPGVASTGGDYIVPLEFFFCHRKGSPNPYFPMCAVSNSKISVLFNFQPQGWITTSTDPIDLLNPFLIVEGVTLGATERLSLQTNQLSFIIPIAYKEAQAEYTNGVGIVNLSANFPVTMLAWFVRNKHYETYDPRFFMSRYNYGYTTKYIHSSIPYTNFDGTMNNYIDIVKTVTMYFNGNNILTTFPNGTYHSVKQPFDHHLTVPEKNIYIYCFTDNPKEYQLDGAVDFTKLDYKTTHIDISFLDQYASQIASAFSLNLYYVGFQVLNVSNGRAAFSQV